MKKYLIIIILFYHSEISTPSFAEEINLPQLIQNQYQTILSFKGSFKQTSFRISSQSLVRKAEGEVFYKRPGKMKWLYKKPEEQLLVTNGTTLWLYDAILENVTIQKLEKLTDGTVLSFLLGIGDLNKDFKRNKISKSLLENPVGLIVELKPKKEAANLAFIQLEVSSESYNLLRVALMDKEGNYRIIALHSMKYNLDLEDKFFEFEVSSDMEVIKTEN